MTATFSSPPPERASRASPPPRRPSAAAAHRDRRPTRRTRLRGGQARDARPRPDEPRRARRPPRVRAHAKIVRDAERFEVHDLGSANGTYVNDARILQHTLAPFDLVRIGGSSFRFRPPIGPSATRPTEKWAEDPNLALRSLYGFVHALSETVEQSEILDVVVARLLEVFAAAGEATVYLLDRSTQRMIIARSHDRNSIAVASMSDHAATTRAPADGCGLSEARAGA